MQNCDIVLCQAKCAIKIQRRVQQRLGREVKCRFGCATHKVPSYEKIVRDGEGGGRACFVEKGADQRAGNPGNSSGLCVLGVTSGSELVWRHLRKREDGMEVQGC